METCLSELDEGGVGLNLGKGGDGVSWRSLRVKAPVS